MKKNKFLMMLTGLPLLLSSCQNIKDIKKLNTNSLNSELSNPISLNDLVFSESFSLIFNSYIDVEKYVSMDCFYYCSNDYWPGYYLNAENHIEATNKLYSLEYTNRNDINEIRLLNVDYLRVHINLLYNDEIIFDFIIDQANSSLYINVSDCNRDNAIYYASFNDEIYADFRKMINPNATK